MVRDVLANLSPTRVSHPTELGNNNLQIKFAFIKENVQNRIIFQS